MIRWHAGRLTHQTKVERSQRKSAGWIDALIPPRRVQFLFFGNFPLNEMCSDMNIGDMHGVLVWV